MRSRRGGPARPHVRERHRFEWLGRRARRLQGQRLLGAADVRWEWMEQASDRVREGRNC